MAPSEAQASHRPDGDVGLPHWLRASLHCPDHLLLHAVLTTPVDRPGAGRLLYWRAPAPGSSQSALAFPERTAGRHPPLSFRGLLKLHSRYGLQSCSPTLRGLCHEAPARLVTQPNRSSAIKAYRQLLAWVLPPLVICAIEAHVRFAILCFQWTVRERGEFAHAPHAHGSCLILLWIG